MSSGSERDPISTAIARAACAVGALPDREDRRAVVEALVRLYLRTPSDQPPSRASLSPAERAAKYRASLAASREPSRASRDGVTKVVTENVTENVTNRDEPPSPSLHSPSPLSSPDLPDSQQIRRDTGEATDGPEAAPVANRWALVDHFCAGVNEASGGTYATPRGSPMQQVGEALGLHVKRAGRGRALDVCRDLGRRWGGYCGGAPEGPFRVVEWLGKGAPATKPPLSSLPPANEAQKRAAEARRAAESRKRDEEYAARKRERMGGPPPEVAALVAGVLREEPASSTRIRPAHEQLEELMRLEGKETGT